MIIFLFTRTKNEIFFLKYFLPPLFLTYLVLFYISPMLIIKLSLLIFKQGLLMVKLCMLVFVLCFLMFKLCLLLVKLCSLMFKLSLLMFKLCLLIRTLFYLKDLFIAIWLNLPLFVVRLQVVLRLNPSFIKNNVAPLRLYLFHTLRPLPCPAPKVGSLCGESSTPNSEL